MAFSSSINFFLTISYISLFSFLLYATGTTYKASEVRHSNHPTTAGSLGLDYNSFAIDVDVLSRACSIRLLTSNARLAALQQNIHCILRLLFGDYHLIETFFKDYEALYKERLIIISKSDIKAMDIFSEIFIRYNMSLKSLVVTRTAQRDKQSIQESFKYYQVNARLSSVGALYGKLIAKGVDLSFVLRLFHRITSSSEVGFKCLAPDIPTFTNFLNEIVKEFICKSYKRKGEKVEQQASPLIMEHLANDFFKKILNAQLFTIKQGSKGHLYGYISGKQCTVYGDKIFPGIGYFEDGIKFIDRCKLPLCPSATEEDFQDSLCYCIYTYNLGEVNKINSSDFRECEKETTISLIKTAMPLMRVSNGTVLSVYIVFPKDCLINLLCPKGSNFTKTKYINKDYEDKDIPYYSMSDEQLRILMKHFANYLYTNANTTLFEWKSL